MHEIRLDEKPRLTGTRSADDQHILVSGMGGILRSAGHHQPLCRGQDDVIPRISGHVRRYILLVAPTGAAVLDVLPVLLRVLAFDIYNKPDNHSTGNTDQEIKPRGRKEVTEGRRKALTEPQHFSGSVNPGRKADRLAELCKYPYKDQIRQMRYNISLDNIVLAQRSGPPCSLLRTRSLPMDCTISLNLRS